MAFDQTSRLLLELYRSARESPIPEFHDRALLLLKSVCRFQSALWGIGEVAPTGLAVHSVHLHNLSEDFFVEYEEVKENDLVAFEAARRMGEVCSFNVRDLMPEARYAQVALLDKRWEMQNLLVATTIEKPLGSVGFVTLYRAKDRDRYTDDDRLRGESLLPHFLEAETINRLVWLNERNVPVHAERGARAIANLRGGLETFDPAFCATLRKEWPAWTPPIVPRPLLEAFRSSREGRFAGKHITVVLALERDMLFLAARDAVSADRLSPAQRDVAILISEGFSYKEAAKRLSLSPATVRNQLHSVYAKLGVNNKVALARRLNEYES